MIKEFQAFFELFKKGKELTNAAIWKNRQIAGNAVVGVLTAGLVIAGGFGFNVAVDQQTIMAAGGGIAALVSIINAVITVVTSKKVGL
jgi:hypothetical protein